METIQSDLRYLRAVAVSQCNHRNFRRWSNIDIDTDGTSDASIHAALEQLIYARRVNMSTSSLASVCRSVLPDDTRALLAACRHRDVGQPAPEPEPEPQPQPEPGEPPELDGGQRIALVNLSEASNAQMNKWHYAWAWQLEKHYGPEYGHVDIAIMEPEEGDIRHEILNTADGNFGGYHTTDELGNPIARTFLDSGQPAIVGSHENVEVARNGWVRLWILLNIGLLQWDEIADPVQRISYPAPNGELVSDFTLHAWNGHWNEFDPEDLHAAARYANMPVLTKYHQLARGGYTGQLNTSTGGLEYVYGSQALAVPPSLSCRIRHEGMIRQMQAIDPRIHFA